MTNSQLPLISIGMPIRNEEKFLEAALESLANQQDVLIEIIISDNASTDATQTICQEFCERYHFIRYHRFEQNVGVKTNFEYVLRQATGRFFIWTSGHDLWDSNFMHACSNALIEHPSAQIAFGSTRWIDADGHAFPRESGWCDTRGMNVIGRYFAVFWGNMNPIIAMIRTDTLKAQIIDDMVGGDLRILLNIAMTGDFIHAWQTRWSRREFRKEIKYQQKLERYRGADYALNNGWLGRHFPLALLPVRIVGDVFRSHLRLAQKLMIFSILMPSLFVKYIVDKKPKENITKAAPP